MKASVVVTYLDSGRTLPEFTRRIQAQDYPDYEVVMIDGAEYGRCSEVEGQRIGLRKSKGEVILITNSDVMVGPHWVSDHMSHYPGPDIVLGSSPHLPMHTLLSLSFTNFSALRWVFDAYPIRETLHQDLDFSARIWRDKRAKWVIDNSIRVLTDDHEVKGMKAFMYLTNIVILYKKYGIVPLPPVIPLSALKSAVDRPEKILGIIAGLLAPTHTTLGRRVKHK